jgi:hypothetical protein
MRPPTRVLGVVTPSDFPDLRSRSKHTKRKCEDRQASRLVLSLSASFSITKLKRVPRRSRRFLSTLRLRHAGANEAASEKGRLLG